MFKTYIHIVIGLLLIQGVAISQQTNLSDFSESLLQNFETVNNTQITYQALEYYEINMPNSMKQEYLDEIQQYQKLIDDRRRGTLSEKDEEMWSPISDDVLIKMIQERQYSLNPQPKEAIYIFSTDGAKIRQDVFRLNAINTKEFFYLYDGVNGSLTTQEDNTVRTGDFLAHRWTNFSCFARFGSGMEKVFKQHVDYESHLVLKNGKQKLIVETAYLQRKNRYVEFTLLDSNPNYWAQCDHIHNDVVITRYICEEFEDHNGFLVPKIVRNQKLYEDGLRDEYVLTLIDVKINDIEFGDDFFKASTSETPIVRRMDR